MVKLLEQDIREDGRKSSKGNQLKWYKDENWYKADYTGYEGLSEYIVSSLLSSSNLEKTEYVPYQTEEMSYKQRMFLGCKSRNFLPDDWKLITLERLFQSVHGESLSKAICAIHDITERIDFLVSQTVRLTGLDAVEDLYGRHLRFRFDDKEVEHILADETYYLDEIKQRVQTVIRKQRQKYQYLMLNP